MPSLPDKILRICEWAQIESPDLSENQRQQLHAAAVAWAQQQNLSTPPLSFGGPNGQLLCATQYVGVVEIDDVTIEIYPKLDSALIPKGDSASISNQAHLIPVMRNLLWMLEVSEHREMVEAETGHLEEAPTTFFDLFAYLLGKHLLDQLMSGITHNYVARVDDLSTVRGRIRLGDQASRNWNRFDRIACTWDEFTPNTSVNRLFKCACRFLANRVSYNEAARLLIDCLALLDGVEDVSPLTALREVEGLRFDRSMDRFRPSFDLANRLLRSSGHALGVGGANTYVFLIDMNKLFESYVHAALEASFDTVVHAQEIVGCLFQLKKGGIQQKADFLWQQADEMWIGDAKYKHLARGQATSLRFKDMADVEQATIAGRLLTPDDVRQLVVYAELAKETTGSEVATPSLALFYPFIGFDSECIPDCAKTWNGSNFWIVPVRVKKQNEVADVIPSLLHNP